MRVPRACAALLSVVLLLNLPLLTSPAAATTATATIAPAMPAAAAMPAMPAMPAAAAASTVTHDISVSGTEVGMYPAFAPDIERYGVTTTAATGGAVTVAATTSDPGGTVLVNGRPASGPSTMVSGLSGGDEISVIFHDAGGTEVHSLIYLPARFPEMTEVVPAAPGTSPGDLLVTLNRYSGGDSPNFEAALDTHGVPTHVRSNPAGSPAGDLKAVATPGHFSVWRGPAPEGRTGGEVVELDAAFAEVRRLSTVGLVDTDVHDSVLRPDGSRILLAYEPDSATGLIDAVIQEVDAGGDVVYTWDSGDHLDPASETTNNPGDPEYAHINSIEVMPDGDILASFRHLSSVLKIAWSAHDGFDRGDVVWRLGGRASDFVFPNDPDWGPCANHTATPLANGHILIFDNGSAAVGTDPARCVDATGQQVSRPSTRITEYALDPDLGIATLTWSFQPPQRFAYFAGSARRLDNGNTLVGWGSERRALASEVDSGGQVLWELSTGDSYLSYRAAKANVPDVTDPVVDVVVPAEGASYAVGQSVLSDFGCTDRGGSSLQSCTGPRGALDTAAPGPHTFTVTGTDGDGNATTQTRHYDVAAPTPTSRPDLSIRTPGGRWAGADIHGGTARQQVSQALPRRNARRTAWVRVQNEGNRIDRVTVRGSAGNRRFRVRYYLGRLNVTSRVVAGSYRRGLRPGAHVDLKVVVSRLKRARVGNRYRVVVRGFSALDGRRTDRVAENLRATRR